MLYGALRCFTVLYGALRCSLVVVHDNLSVLCVFKCRVERWRRRRRRRKRKRRRALKKARGDARVADFGEVLARVEVDAQRGQHARCLADLAEHEKRVLLLLLREHHLRGARDERWSEGGSERWSEGGRVGRLENRRERVIVAVGVVVGVVVGVALGFNCCCGCCCWCCCYLC